MNHAHDDSKHSKIHQKLNGFGLKAIMEVFDVSPKVALSVFAACAAVLALALLYCVESLPPTQLTITTGPEGSGSQKTATKYAQILEKEGVKVKILTSKGSIENLERLTDPKSHVDIGFVQNGLTVPGMDNLISLGSVSYQPMLIFYRGKPFELLADLKNKKIAIGPEGSGSHNIALSLLQLNGFDPKSVNLIEEDPETAANSLMDKKIDAAFVMSESASSEIMKKLLHSEEVHLYNFKQASAYSRKIDSLNVLELPEGSIDFGKNIPNHDVSLVGPVVELVATKNLHPALSDLLLDAATQVHNHPGLFQKRGEFPNATEHTIRISDDANRFYKSGKTFFYRYLPYWLASLMSRMVVVFLPTLIVLIPIIRLVPAFFRWRAHLRIRQRYRELMLLEQRILREKDHAKQEILRKNFDRIEESVNQMRVKAAFADQFYGLRGHIDYVRKLAEKKQQA